MFQDIGLRKKFLGKTQKVQATKTKNNKWDYIKLHRFFTAEERINRAKNNMQNRKKYFKTIHLTRG